MVTFILTFIIFMLLPLEFDRYGNPKSFIKLIRNFVFSFIIVGLCSFSIAHAETLEEIERNEHYQEWHEYCLTRGGEHYTMFLINDAKIHKMYFCKNKDKLIKRLYHEKPPEKIDESKIIRNQHTISISCWQYVRSVDGLGNVTIRGQECS